jgi:hypothetical protein|eukprot:COSAG06_NODE_1130_length_10600_cov_4.501571_2_plen_80_part_00
MSLGLFRRTMTREFCVSAGCRRRTAATAATAATATAAAAAATAAAAAATAAAAAAAADSSGVNCADHIGIPAAAKQLKT